MKTKHIIISALALSALTLTSCDDFLDTSSKTELNTETVTGSLEAVEMTLVGCYDGWQNTVSNMSGPGFYLTSEFASEQAFAGLGTGDARNYSVIDEFNTGVASSYNNIFNQDWINYYKAIFRCNELLANDEKINWEGDEAARARILGEAHALRAILYFDLTRMFGDVPLVTEPTEENIPRSSASDVYQVIFDDLKFAAENIPADAYPLENRNNNDGRITKYAAEALLARAYLYYTGYYGSEHSACTKAEATAAIDDVVAKGGYELEASYADLFMPACTSDASSGTTYAWNSTYKGKYYNNGWTGDISKEIVLNLKFNSTGGYSSQADGNTFSVFLGPRQYNAANICISAGWGACSVTPYFVSQYQNDPRFSTCCWSCDEAGFTPYDDTYQYTGYYTRKYAPMCFADGTRQEVGFALGEQHKNMTYYQDWTIMRYADVLLMHSELHETADGINQVRARVGLSPVTYSVENLRKERAIEFAFEGIHYWDIMRYEKDGAYAAKVIAEAQNGVTVENGGVEAITSFTESNFTSKKGLMQIPNTQITLSGNVLTQNAGW